MCSGVDGSPTPELDPHADPPSPTALNQARVGSLRNTTPVYILLPHKWDSFDFVSHYVQRPNCTNWTFTEIGQFVEQTDVFVFLSGPKTRTNLWRVGLQHTSPARNLRVTLGYQVPKINTASAEQLSSWAELHYWCHWPVKTLATTSLPEYVATHSLKTDYLAPFRTRHLLTEKNIAAYWATSSQQMLLETSLTPDFEHVCLSSWLWNSS